MKERSTGFLVSLFIHLLFAGGILVFMARTTMPVRTLSLDFSLLEGERGKAARGATVRAEDRIMPGQQRMVRNEVSGRREKGKTEDQAKQLVRQPDLPKAPVSATPGIESDPDGQVSVKGVQHLAGRGSSTTVGASQGIGTAGHGVAPGVGTGGSKSLNYGAGGKDEIAHSYIREAIMKHITYPERARRMGWEGRVVLSFMVFEDGTVHEVKVVNSSGFKILDENAREAVLNTHFLRKSPYRLVVHLPVDYRLE